MALMAVAIMMAAVLLPLGGGDGDAAGANPSRTVSVDVGGTQYFTLVVTETALDQTGLTNEVTWTINETVVYTSASGGSSTSYTYTETNTNYFTISSAGVDSTDTRRHAYTFKVAADEENTCAEKTIKLVYTVKTKSSNTEVAKQTLTYDIKVTVTAVTGFYVGFDVGQNSGSFGCSWDDNNAILTVKYGKDTKAVSNFKSQKGDSSKLQNYVYYAVGLPDGLAMDGNGNITGVPRGEKTSGTSYTEVKVYATATAATTSPDHMISSFKVNITDNEGFLFTAKLYDKAGSKELAHVDSPVVYYTLASETSNPTLKVEPSSNGILSNPVADIIDDKGKRVSVQLMADAGGTSASCEITSPDSNGKIGSGQYTIIVYNGPDGNRQSVVLTLHVLPVIGDVSAGIGFVPTAST